MSYLGQNEEYDVDVDFNDVETEIPWWKQLWAGTKEVLTTGAEVFQKVAPAIFDRPEIQPPGGGVWDPRYPTYPYPITRPQTRIATDPRTGRQQTIYDAPYIPGQRLDPGMTIITLPSGQRITRRVQRAGVMPAWGTPLLLLGGGFVLMNLMGKRKKK